MLPVVKNFLRGDAAGLTFVELLVTITVLVIVTLPLLNLFTASYAGIVRAGHKTAAVNLCREKIEVIKARGYSYFLDSINGSPEGVYVEIEEPPGEANLFRRETKLQLIDVQLEGDRESVPVIAISVQVKWRELEVERAVKMESYLARRRTGCGGR